MTPRKRANAAPVPAGAALVAALNAELGESFEWDAREAKLIATAADLADRLQEVRNIVDRDGAMLTAVSGTVRAHPLLSEQRQLSIALAKVLEAVRMPAESSGSLVSLRKSRAARVRWDRVAHAAEGGA